MDDNLWEVCACYLESPDKPITNITGILKKLNLSTRSFFRKSIE